MIIFVLFWTVGMEGKTFKKKSRGLTTRLGRR